MGISVLLSVYDWFNRVNVVVAVESDVFDTRRSVGVFLCVFQDFSVFLEHFVVRHGRQDLGNTHDRGFFGGEPGVVTDESEDSVIRIERDVAPEPDAHLV